MLLFDTTDAYAFIEESELELLEPQLMLANRQLDERTAPGSEYLGWLNLPETYDKVEYQRITAAAKRIRETADVLVVVGIGGSYLGSRAAVDMLTPAFSDQPSVVFCGQNLSADYMNELLAWLDGRDVCVNVISKSGTTTEPAIAFRVLRSFMEKKYGAEGAKERIFATTDRSRGALKTLADEKGYETFTVPDDVGGRYSVLTAVGLLPIAAAGIDTDAILAGAAEMLRGIRNESPNDIASRYAAVRTVLLRRGFSVEMLVNYEPGLQMFGEWWKQLFGESEGKDGKGLFPAAVNNTTDLHSMGQYIQDGARLLFETVLDVRSSLTEFSVPSDPADGDGLEFLAGRDLHAINRTALQGTVLAHVDGGVPNLRLEIPDRSPWSFGQMVYFFEKACAVSGCLLAVNPFDQPGVEAYKRNMFALLGKPGFEAQRTELEKRIRSK